MATKNKLKVKKETMLLVVGSLLLIISFILYHYEKILMVIDELKNDIETEIYKEKTKGSLEVNVDTLYIDSDDTDNYKEEVNSGSPNYLGFIEIDKINLRQGFLPKDSYYNNINYHVQILKISDFPDVVGGNLILAAHSGSGYISYFHNLYKLSKGDIAKIYYKGKVYRYKIINIYKEKKDGSINIYRDTSKTTLTLITCTRNDKTTQTIYISELIGVETY